MTKIERVAIQLQIASGINYKSGSYWRMMAEAAIAAMGEPAAKPEAEVTPEMIEAGRCYLQDTFDLATPTAANMARELFESSKTSTP